METITYEMIEEHDIYVCGVCGRDLDGCNKCLGHFVASVICEDNGKNHYCCKTCTPAGSREVTHFPNISVVATNYQCAHALDRHLTSIYKSMDGLDFEYIIVDNFSKDDSWNILNKWMKKKDNLHCIQKKSTRGNGRQTGVLMSMTDTILIVDTDTVYHPWLGNFVNTCMRDHENKAVQSIYAGVYPKDIWVAVNGQRSMNIWEDLDLWMRIHEIGKMKFYPVHAGINLKDHDNSNDHNSTRYKKKSEKIMRLIFGEYNKYQCRIWEGYNLDALWRNNSIDLGFGKVTKEWFGNNPRGSLKTQILRVLRQSKAILKS